VQVQEEDYDALIQAYMCDTFDTKRDASQTSARAIGTQAVGYNNPVFAVINQGFAEGVSEEPSEGAGSLKGQRNRFEMLEWRLI